MRDLKRNQQEIWYALLTETKDEDEWGNTVNAKGYGEPQEFKASVSANKGEASAQAFGADLKYDREVVTHDMSCPIDEYSRLWLDGRTTDKPHNYVVVAVSKSLNSIRYAIRRVDVS